MFSTVEAKGSHPGHWIIFRGLSMNLTFDYTFKHCMPQFERSLIMLASLTAFF